MPNEKSPAFAVAPSVDPFLDCDASKLAALNPIERVAWRPLDDLGVHFYVKREDLLDQQISGNKLYKLIGHLRLAREQGARVLLSFGGYYSNHLHALAAVGHRLGLATVGVIRGERPVNLNPMLMDCIANGMQLEFISRVQYREKTNGPFLAELRARFGEVYIIPEGGAGEPGLVGCQALGEYIASRFAEQSLSVCVPCGTGTTLTGLLAGSAGLGSSSHAYEGISVLKPRPDDQRLEVDVESGLLAHNIGDTVKWRVHYGFHAGGYAKFPAELFEFMVAFELETSIPLDPVYTVKMMWAIQQLAQQGRWREGDHVLALHTGGLQGRRGFAQLSELPARRGQPS